MEVRCPQCHSPIELEEEAELSAIVCSVCGSRFSLLGEETVIVEAAVAKTVGRFELGELLGTGAFASVWKARDTELDRTVAVKIPRKGQLAPEEAEQFLREARAAAQLQHPNIVSVHEVGREEDTVYIVSDVVQGLTLADWLSGKRVTSREAADLCAKMARALEHAHEAGVIHRDLKPANVMLDEDGEPHIMDFGLARRETGEVTMTMEGKVLGTPAYMSPEQARGEAHQADRRTDVYSLGVILFELLTGEKPFRGNVRMLLHQLISEEVPSPRKLESSVPRDLETICLKCLEKDADGRFSSAQELAEELERFVRAEPIRSRPISAMERMWRWARRNKAIAASLAVIFVLLVATTIGSMMAAGSFRRLAREKQQESIAAFKAQRLAEQRENEAKEARDSAEQAEEQAYEARDQARRRQRDAEENRQRAEELAASSDQKAYAGEMMVASGFANQHNGMGRVRDFVDAWIPEAGQTDLRHWEWYYMTGLAHRGISPVAGRGGAAEVTWDSRSKAVLVVNPNGRIESHDAETGRMDVLVESPEDIQGAAAWNKDRTVVAAACVDGKIRVWKAKEAELLADLDVGESKITGMAWHPDGQWLAATTNKGKTLVWDWPKREIICRLDVDRYRKDSVSWHPKKPLLAVSLGDEVVISDVTSGEEQCRLSSGWLRCLRWSPDGRRVAAVGRADISVWNVERKELVATLTGYRQLVTELAWDPRGSQLAASLFDNTVRVWDAKDGTIVHVLRGHSNKANHVAWSPDGRFLVSNGWSGNMRVWDAVKGADDLAFRLQNGCCRWLPHPDQIAVAVDRTVTILNATTGQADESWTVALPIRSFAFDSAAERVAYRSSNGRVWLSERGESSDGVVLDEGKGNAYVGGLRMQGIAWSPDDSLVAALTPQNQIAVWDATTGSLVATPRQLPKHVLALAWSPDGQMLAYGGDAGQLALWDAKNRCDLRVASVYGHVFGIHWKSDSTELLRTGGHHVDVIDVNSGQRVRQLMGPASTTKSVTATRDDTRIAVTSRDGTVTIWDGKTDSVVASFQVHPSSAFWVGWNSDETRLASLAVGGALRVCDAQIGLEEARDPRALARLTRSPDGSLSSRRIEALHEIATQHARPDEAIPLLDAAYSRNPKNGQVAFMLADLLHARAELHKSAGRFDEAEKDDQRAGALFKQLVEEHPDDEQYLDADTNFQIDRLERWAILRPTEMTSEGIDRLERLSDGSILASGPLGHYESYTITASCPLSQVTAIRLEGLRHPSLYQGGCGRASEFYLGDVHIEVARNVGKPEFAEVPISQVSVDSNFTGAEIHGRAGENRSGIRGYWRDYASAPRVAVFRVNQMRLAAVPFLLRIKLSFRGGGANNYAALGRIRLAVTDSASTQETLLRQGILRNLKGSAAYRRAALLWHQESPKEAIMRIEAAEPLNSRGQHFLAALLYYEVGNDELARRHLDSAVTAEPLGYMWSQACLFGLPALRRGAERGHSSVQHSTWLARMLSRTGNLDQAIDELKTLIEEDDAEMHTFFTLARLYRGSTRGDADTGIDSALETLSRGLRKFPGDGLLSKGLVSAWSERASLSYRNSDWENAAHAHRQAAQTCEEQIPQNPKDMWCIHAAQNQYEWLVRVLSKLGRTDEARNAWKQMCQKGRDLAALVPKHAAYHNGLAWSLVASPFPDLWNASEALEYAETAVSLDPKAGNCWSTLGVVRYRLDDLDGALAALDRSSELGLGGDPFDWYFRAMIHHRQGDAKQAKYWLRRSNRWTEKNAPDNEELKRFRTEAEELLARGPISSEGPKGASQATHQ